MDHRGSLVRKWIPGVNHLEAYMDPGGSLVRDWTPGSSWELYHVADNVPHGLVSKQMDPGGRDAGKDIWTPGVH